MFYKEIGIRNGMEWPSSAFSIHKVLDVERKAEQLFLFVIKGSQLLLNNIFFKFHQFRNMKRKEKYKKLKIEE